MTYIYLNTYILEGKEYLYVGSHTWDGEGLDPNYHGSSGVVRFYPFKLVKEEIIKVVPEDNRLRLEHNLIEEYLLKYGISNYALELAKTNWVYRWRQGGKMLNCHSNDNMQRTLAAAKKIKECGKTEAQIKHNMDNLQTLYSSEERLHVRARKCVESTTPEARSNSAKLRWSKRIKHARRCKLSDGFVGCCSEIARHLDWSSGSVSYSISIAFKNGRSLLKGIEFIPIRS